MNRMYDKIKSKDIYNNLLNAKHDMITPTKSILYWMEKYNLTALDFRDIFMIPLRSIRDTHIQTLQYKIINKVHNNNKWLCQIAIIASNKCRHCSNIEDVEHFFYSCPLTKVFWQAFLSWWNANSIYRVDTLQIQDILFGVPLKQKIGITFNCSLLIAKESIQEAKQNQRHPCLHAFLVKLKNYLTIESQIKNTEIVSNLWEGIWENMM